MDKSDEKNEKDDLLVKNSTPQDGKKYKFIVLPMGKNESTSATTTASAGLSVGRWRFWQFFQRFRYPSHTTKPKLVKNARISTQFEPQKAKNNGFHCAMDFGQF